MDITWMFEGSTEASALGWEPGHWPETLEAPLPTGRTVKFARNGQIKHPESGDFIGYDYRYVDPDHETGSDGRLKVYND